MDRPRSGSAHFPRSVTKSRPSVTSSHRADTLLACILGPAACHSDPITPSFDQHGQYTVIDPADTEQVTKMWDLIRQLSACIDLTPPRTPLVTHHEEETEKRRGLSRH